jgi:EAL domain-containing protein (putative c-di-GMP-specific phosphodiesterase class I)/CheY-like chemotaxis protein
MISKQKLLIVDDEEELCEVISATAQAMGFECIATTDAKMFLENLGPDTSLVLLDLRMPKMDGIELLRLLGKRQCKADIVLMSGVGKRTMESALQLAQVLGLSIVGHLNKPFQLAELEEVLQRIPGPGTPRAVHPILPFLVEKEELKSAIENDEFEVYYQPQIDLATRCVIGVEALARWRHPTRGLVFPDLFIGPMDEFGLIDELGWIVANRAMSELRQFSNGDENDFTLSLNASVNSLHDLNFPDILVSIAEKHDVSPGNITIEITETGLIKELSKTLDILTRLRMKQVKLSIDDFGTGYSMFQQITNIPATELKIDKSFVQEMVGNDRYRMMVQKTIELGHGLGMRVTAEGVETHDQLRLLRRYGCDRVQGYLFSRPIPAKDMVIWLKTYRSSLVQTFPRSGQLNPLECADGDELECCVDG